MPFPTKHFTDLPTPVREAILAHEAAVAEVAEHRHLLASAERRVTDTRAALATALAEWDARREVKRETWDSAAGWMKDKGREDGR